MKPSRLHTVLSSMLRQRWPAFVWGAPGVGKSSIVRDVAAQAGLPVLDLRATLLDPTDLRGIPTIRDGVSSWCPPSFLPKPTAEPGILFLDEINAAPPLVQASLYQLVLDRKVGEYQLPPGWWIVAAGNRQQDKSVTFRMSAALTNRFVHLVLEPDVADWRSWAIERKVHPLVLSFIGARPQLLCESPGGSAAYCTPRTWEMLSDVLTGFGSIENAKDLFSGIVGEGAAVEFTAYARSALQEKEIEAIVARPADAKLPESLDGMYVLTSWLAFHGRSRPEIVKAGGVILGRIPPEFGVVLARDLIQANPGFVRESGYKAFVQKHGALISR
jgi:hypothetical protein